MAKNTKFQINDTIKVKNGTVAPDLGIDISGWHGQIIEIVNDLVIINLDGIALSNISDQYIFQCQQDNLDWERICLKSHEIQIAVRRDTEEDLRTIRKKIQAKHYWDYLGASGKIINQVLSMESDDHLTAFNAWGKYLDQNLSLPFDAEISEPLSSGLLKQGDKIRIHSITGNEDPYGVIAEIKLERKIYHFPLFDIEPLDKNSLNSRLLDAYRNWFGNR
jgi:hypothetical protein